MKQVRGSCAEARWWHPEDGRIRCDLCPHRCLLDPGETGLCGVRQAKLPHGPLLSLNAGLASSIHLDPIEKKPLFHWHPGTEILSVGTVGCNLRCPFCQNWELARWDKSVPLTPISYFDLSKALAETGSNDIAFTYNEPLVWFEFIADVAGNLHESGHGIVLVTNGTINPDPLREIIPFISAANVDLKAFSEETYRAMGGYLQTVLDTIRTMVDGGVHVELTHLLVPGMNTDRDLFEAMIDWICGIDPNIPFHLSRYFPRWKWKEPPTSLELMEEFGRLAAGKLRYVYLGNVPGTETTRCRGCGRDIVVRQGYNIMHIELAPDGKCLFCGQDNGFVMPD